GGGRFTSCGDRIAGSFGSRRAACGSIIIVSSGKIGRPLNARVVSASSGFGPAMPSTQDYFNNAPFGANLLTITGGHTLDVVEAVLGAIVEVDARTGDSVARRRTDGP